MNPKNEEPKLPKEVNEALAEQFKDVSKQAIEANRAMSEHQQRLAKSGRIRRRRK